jgi:hypothetical protein
MPFCSYSENTAKSDIIVIGKTTCEESRNDTNTCKIEIYEFLKGSQAYESRIGKIPRYFLYTDPFTQPVKEKIGLYFFNISSFNDSSTKPWPQQLLGSSVICLNDSLVIYERYYNDLMKAYDRQISIDTLKNPTDLEKKIIKWYIKLNKSSFNKAIIHESWDLIINNIKHQIEVNTPTETFKKNQDK